MTLGFRRNGRQPLRERRRCRSARVFFNGLEVTPLATYTDGRRGVLRGFCADTHGAKHPARPRRGLQRFEARGHVRVIFDSASEVTAEQAARNLHRFGIGRAIVWDDWSPRIARLEGFPPAKVAHSFYASPQVYERCRWAVKMVWGPVPLGQRPQLQAAVRERLVPLTQRQDVQVHADGRIGVGFVFSVYDEEGEDGYWVQAHVIGRGSLSASVVQ
jgi:hypothetical protein